MQRKHERQTVNHKMFISWREFMSYFDDYQVIEKRNKNISKTEEARDNLRKAKNPVSNKPVDPQEEFKTLME